MKDFDDISEDLFGGDVERWSQVALKPTEVAEGGFTSGEALRRLIMLLDDGNRMIHVSAVYAVARC
ncbi:MAG: hypothetical protein KIH01_00735 [Candidatus Freyarchaeota archaeon]|nr:hypothetical protein [Candidatus Jordarchaeia archaeon]